MSTVGVTAGAHGTTTTFSSGPTATTTQASELLIGLVGSKAVSPVVPTWDAGWTALPGTAVSTSWFFNIAYQVVTVTGNYTASGTTSGPWMAGIATLK